MGGGTNDQLLNIGGTHELYGTLLNIGGTHELYGTYYYGDKPFDTKGGLSMGSQDKLYGTYYGDNLHETEKEDNKFIKELEGMVNDDVVQGKVTQAAFEEVKKPKPSLWMVSYEEKNRSRKKCYVLAVNLKGVIEKCKEHQITDDRICSANRINEYNESVLI